MILSKSELYQLTIQVVSLEEFEDGSSTTDQLKEFFSKYGVYLLIGTTIGVIGIILVLKRRKNKLA